jgi:hypothetical protein
VPTAAIQNLAVTTAKINDAAVTTAKINDAAVTIAKLALPFASAVTFANNVAVTGAETGSTQRSLAKVSGSDVVTIGASTNALALLSNGTATLDGVAISTGTIGGASDVTVNNDVAFKGKDTGGTARTLAKMSTGDVVQIGSANNALDFLSNGTLTHNGGTMPGSSNTFSYVTSDGSGTSVSLTTSYQDFLSATTTSAGTWLLLAFASVNYTSTTVDVRSNGGNSGAGLTTYTVGNASATGIDMVYVQSVISASNGQALAIQGKRNTGSTATMVRGYLVILRIA